MAAPTFIWRDPAPGAVDWRIEVSFADGSKPLSISAQAARLSVGPIDKRCVAPTNEIPKLTPQQAASRTWVPDDASWAAIRKHSVSGPATVTIAGYKAGASAQPVSRGRVVIHTSKDPVGAPIFYRDVPLTPSEVQKGVIKPLEPNKLPLIAWRLRNVSERQSRVLMEGLHTCANCHSFSRDGKTLGLDLDGPQNDKGLYAIIPVKPRTAIRNEDVIAWGSFRGKLGDQLRVGFMSQVSPDGQFIVTTIKPAGTESDPAVSRSLFRARYRKQPLYYVSNFKDYRFLQVFYPTRGILVWYSRATGRLQPLPGADDPRFVNTNAVWSPDGKYLVFSRAQAKDPYPPGVPLAQRANDPNETPIRYDLYRIPFNEGRGGRAEPIAGASNNGMSNSFPKISPDGRWLVFVQARNGLLMRPDGQLYIVPVEGGQARRMRCNTPLMNSWHSFSPNGRWMVFSSKSRSPYTQMYLTHLDAQGQDSPAILVDNATLANRAVNIPEFVNVTSGGLLSMDAPATEFYRLFEVATGLMEKDRYEEAVQLFRRALQLNPTDARSRVKIGIALARTGRLDESIAECRKAAEFDPAYADAYMNLGIALAQKGNRDEAIRNFESGLKLSPDNTEAHANFAGVLLNAGRTDEAITHCRKALAVNPEYTLAHSNLAIALVKARRLSEAVPHFEKALAANPESVELHYGAGRALAETGRFDEAIPHLEKALAARPASPELHYNLANLLAVRGRFQDAVTHFEKVLEIAPAYAQARFELGNALYSIPGRLEEALAQWSSLLRAQPSNVIVLNRIARARATSTEASVRNGPEAVKLAERAVQLSGGQEPATLDTLSAAYAEVGRFRDALEAARRALELSRRKNNTRLTEVLSARIALYQVNKPIRE